jgi:hypothetical protein
MKPTVIDIVSNVVVRDYIQYFGQVATDIVNLNSDGKNKYELRREAENLILEAIVNTTRWHDTFYDRRPEYNTVELLLFDIWKTYRESPLTTPATWYIFFSDLNKIAKHLEDEYTRRLNQLIDKNNAS